MEQKTPINTKKKLLIVGGIIGTGLIIKTIKKNNDMKNNHPSKNIIKKELAECIKAQFIFENILLNEDKYICIENINDTSSFKSLDFARDFYFKSTDFKTQEIRKISKYWYLHKLNVLSLYIGTSTEDKIKESLDKLIKANEELEKLIKFYSINMEDIMSQDIKDLQLNNNEILNTETNIPLVSFINTIK